MPLRIQKAIRQLDPHVYVAGVEAHMRYTYGMLDHLPNGAFAREVEIARQCEFVSPDTSGCYKGPAGFATEEPAESRAPECRASL